MRELFDASLKPSSYPTYRRAYNWYRSFLIDMDLQGHFGLWSEDRAVLFIAYLCHIGYAATTIRTYLSAVNHVHIVKGVASVTQEALVKKALDGVDKSSPASVQREPITKDLLYKLTNAVNSMSKNYYHKLLLKAVFTFMYAFCTRVGEVSVSNGTRNNVIHLSDVQVVEDPRLGRLLWVTFRNFKHNKNSAPHVIKVKATGGMTCPVDNLLNYLGARPSGEGPLFLGSSGKGINSSFVSANLSRALIWAGEDQTLFGTHSFRIGRCSDLAKDGASAETIRVIGRFHSDAYLKYVRPQVFSH